ncbi:hypothetical protein KQI84_06905 [bacterium]|nr:hypothetical protein [bacterium]
MNRLLPGAVMALLCLSYPFLSIASETPVFGDIGKSSAVNLSDAVLMQRELNVGPLPYDQFLDINLDGQLTSRDAELLYLWSIGAIPVIPYLED